MVTPPGEPCVSEESFYRWVGWILFAIALVMLFMPYPAFPWAITGFVATVMSRLVRLECQFNRLLDGTQATLAELQARVNSAVRDE
jgi:FtsH-binding integral membrane protein